MPIIHSSHDDTVRDTMVYSIHNRWKVKQGLQLNGFLSNFLESRMRERLLLSVNNFPNVIPIRFIEIQIKNNVSIIYRFPYR